MFPGTYPGGCAIEAMDRKSLLLHGSPPPQPPPPQPAFTRTILGNVTICIYI